MLNIMYVTYTTILVLYKIELYPTYKYIDWPLWSAQLRNYKPMPTQSPLKQPSYNLPTPSLPYPSRGYSLTYMYNPYRDTGIHILHYTDTPPPTGTLVETYQINFTNTYINSQQRYPYAVSQMHIPTGLPNPPPCNWVYSYMDTHIYILCCVY